jgi:hypothetical protein
MFRTPEAEGMVSYRDTEFAAYAYTLLSLSLSLSSLQCVPTGNAPRRDPHIDSTVCLLPAKAP